ncbi:melanoregulin-like [Osmerus eperlanus]|uniref:melanoregulin-like n=1 Tax=Osmerus eperlanus TaxID=29151 RepID=UPI002E0F3AB5
MGALYTVCCCRQYFQHDGDEKNAILRVQGGRASESSGSEPSPDCVSGEQQDWNPWKSPQMSTGPVASDRELQVFLSMRNQADKDTEEWEKLNYDIHTLRCARREVSTRWRKILQQLGYEREVESLLCVNKTSSMSSRSLVQARELLHTLMEDTSLFPQGVSPQDRYLFVMDRLVSLDSAEDFITLAKQKYPKREV